MVNENLPPPVSDAGEDFPVEPSRSKVAISTSPVNKRSKRRRNIVTCGRRPGGARWRVVFVALLEQL